MTAAVLFDLGNTLVAYYRREEFGPILERAVARTRDQLQFAGLDVVDLDVAMERAVAENREAADFRFAPMADRLARIFDLEGDLEPSWVSPSASASWSPFSRLDARILIRVRRSLS
jgi:hypothetical protein